MKKLYVLILFSAFITITNAQDEGTIVKKERFERSKAIFIGGGPSFTFGKNIGDYGSGLNFVIGFSKRTNRILSLGGSFSYSSFKYDPKKTDVNKEGYKGFGDPNDWSTKYDFSDFQYDYGYLLTLKGGDINQMLLSFDLKLNFIPVTDNSKVSIYGFVRPFVTFSTRKEVSGSGQRYVYQYYELAGPYGDELYYDDQDVWYPDGVVDDWGADEFDALKEEKEITGGVFIGPGIEFMPAKAVSIFAQAAFGYTFPITYVSSASYETTLDSYADPKFPMVKKGFASLNVQVGLAFNF
jgi:hypothetical protein